MKKAEPGKEYHFLTVLMLGMSASVWAVGDRRIIMSLVWLTVLCGFILADEPREFIHFFRRLLKIGGVLLSISLLQIIFRRSGQVILSVGDFPLIFSYGLREALLLWIRFMILFVLAQVMARITVFHFFLFTNKIRLPLDFGLLLLMTVRMIPYIFSEAKRGLWFLRFRGIRFKKLSGRGRIKAVKQLAYALLMRSIDYVFHSALALELRGYGINASGRMQQPYPLKGIDAGMLILIFFINVFGLILY